jgi:hypothetical protein
MLRIGSIAAVAGFVPAVLGAIPGPALAHPAAKISTAAIRLAVDVHYGQPQNASGYSVIIVTGSHSAWVFGGTNPGGRSSPVAARWNGKQITSSPLPTRLTGFLSDASVVSPTDIWAASQYGRYVVRWNGKHWSLARHWLHGMVTGLTALSATNVWAFGTTATGVQEHGTWHFNGRSWTHAAGPADEIYRASAVSALDVWAISAGATSDTILRMHDSKWRLVHTGTALAGVRARDILALSNDNVWVVGNQVSRSGAGRLVLAHWNGQTWTRLTSKLHVWAGRLSGGWRGSVLITATPDGAPAAGMILRATPLAWLSATTISSAQGSGVSDVALMRSSRSVLVSGGVLTRLGGNAAIWTGQLSQPAARPDRDDDA